LAAGAWSSVSNRSQKFVIGGYTAGNPFDALIVASGNSEYVGRVLPR